MSTDEETPALLRPKLRQGEFVALKIEAITRQLTLAQLVATIIREHLAAVAANQEAAQ